MSLSTDYALLRNIDSTNQEGIVVDRDSPVGHSNNNMTKIVHQGWLEKRGEHIRNWRRRYFILMDNGQFIGFKNKPPNDRCITDPENNFTIRNCIIFKDNRPKPFTFHIRGLHHTTIVERIFSVDTEQERLTWISLIEEVKLKLQRENTKDHHDEHNNTKLSFDGKSTPREKRGKRKITFENFEFLKLLGKGTYGKVILCREKASSNLYALKIIKKDMVILNDNIRQILTEKRVLQKSYHPFLLNLKYSFTTFDCLCLVTEFVNGGELYFHLVREGPFNEDRARFYGAEIICALDYLHTNAIIHRDIKLENILLDKDGHIRIIDFGLCKENIHWNSETTTLCGTPEYRAPEIINHVHYGKVVDWWAFGVIMSEMLIGKNPFYNVDLEIMFENVLECDITFPQWLSTSARDLLASLLNKEPEYRLGGGVEGSNQIKSHAFFESIDWNLLILKQISPPFKPEVSDDIDTSNFDVTYLPGERVRLTPSDESNGLEIQNRREDDVLLDNNFSRQLFKQFSYNSINSDTTTSSQHSITVSN